MFRHDIQINIRNRNDHVDYEYYCIANIDCITNEMSISVCL
jgi:hypothetical protein